MSNRNLLASDRAAIVGVIDPDVYSAGAQSTGWISMSDFATIMAIVQVGTMVASSTIDAKIEQAQDAAGTGVKDVTGKAIAQLTQAGGDSDKQAIINCRVDDLDLENDFTHVRLTMTVAAADSDAGAVVLGLDARYGPASDNDLASVEEIVQ